MLRTATVSTEKADPYRTHGIDGRYDAQSSYGRHESYYGKGKYPPDWDRRREAVWERQRYRCGRCGTYKGDVAVSEVHHVVHLADGGSNALDNLVGLCGDCHALMHPDVGDLAGTVGAADLFPDADADDRVAVIRAPADDDLSTDVERLGEISSPDDNAYAVSSEAVPTSAHVARRAGEDLHRLLLDNGYVPRTSAYHRVRVRPRAAGILGAISSHGVDLTARSDGEVLEVDAVADDRIDVYYSADTGATELELEDPTGAERAERLRLTDGARLRVEKPIDVPALSAETAPEYAADALRYVGWESLKVGIVPGLLLALFLPAVVPAAGSIAGLLALVLTLGLLLRAPSIYRDVTAEPVDAVIDERATE